MWSYRRSPCSRARAGARGRTGDGEPDVVLACAGDVPTQETLAAASLLQNDLSRPDFVALSMSMSFPRSLPLRLLARMSVPIAAWTLRSPEALAECRDRCAMVSFEGFLPESGKKI